MSQSENERLARLEEKMDMLLAKFDEKSSNDKAIENRIREAENKIIEYKVWFKVLSIIGGGAWAVILLLLGKVFGKWFGG